MEQDPYGPPLVVGQLQFDFGNIEPLSLDQRLKIWLGHQDQVTPDVLTASLFVQDNESRRRRSERWMEVLSLRARYQQSYIAVSGGSEVIWLYEEACRSYINGFFFCALLSSHAACERVLAGCLFAYREELGKGWLMWGLGKLVLAAYERGIINDCLRDDLTKLSEIRKVSAHFKPAHEINSSVQQRAYYELALNPGADYEDSVNTILQSDALFALDVASYLVLGDFSLAA